MATERVQITGAVRPVVEARGGARRLLAIFALIVSLAALGAVLVTPASPLPRSSTLSAVTIADPLPRLCSACGAAASPWSVAGVGRDPIVVSPSNVPYVDPRDLAAAAQEAPPDRRIGAVEAFAAPVVASYAGVGWERLNFDWASLQPTGPSSWNRAAVSGAMIGQEIAAGREVVGIIGGLPHWASDAHGLPQGLYLPPTSPRNLFGAFVAALVRRYEGRISDWIVWNEPDVWNPHVRGFSWPGSVADFARLQKVAYMQIKGVDPALVVHLAATTYWWDAAYGRPLYLDRLFSALAADPHARAHNWYFDVASAHIYNVPDDVERIVRLDHALMRAHGFDKPLWLVETNATPTRDGPWSMLAPPWDATSAEQAAYVPQAVALALAGGAARVSFYKMADPSTMSARAYPAGLVRPDGTARPAVAALRATTHALAGWTAATDLGIVNGVRAVAVARGLRGVTLVLWNTGPTPLAVTVAVPAPAHASVDWASTALSVVGDDDTRRSVAPVAAGDGVTLHLTLQPGPCAQHPACTSHVGGAPLMILAPSLPHLVY